MPYSSNTDLLKQFDSAELAKLTGDETGTTVDTDRTDNARDIADATIDSYLYGIYDVPLQGTDPIVKKLSVDLTIYYLYSMEYKDYPLPEDVIIRRNYALNLLKDIKEGELTLATEEESLLQKDGILRQESTPNRIFNDDVLDNFFGGNYE